MFVYDRAAIYETYTNELKTLIIGKGVKRIGECLLTPWYSLDNLCYTGSEAEWDAIQISSNSTTLNSATKHYNYLPE